MCRHGFSLFSGSRYQMCHYVYSLFRRSRHQMYIYMFNLFSASRHRKCTLIYVQLVHRFQTPDVQLYAELVQWFYTPDIHFQKPDVHCSAYFYSVSRDMLYMHVFKLFRVSRHQMYEDIKGEIRSRRFQTPDVRRYQRGNQKPQVLDTRCTKISKGKSEAANRVRNRQRKKARQYNDQKKNNGHKYKQRIRKHYAEK